MTKEEIIKNLIKKNLIKKSRPLLSRDEISLVYEALSLQEKEFLNIIKNYIDMCRAHDLMKQSWFCKK